MKAIRQKKNETKAVYLVAKSWGLRHRFEKIWSLLRFARRKTILKWSSIQERERWLETRSRMNAEARQFSKFL